MDVYHSTSHPLTRYYIQIGDTVYHKCDKDNITSWFDPKVFTMGVASGDIKVITNPPIEIINEFEVFRTKLILGLPYEDI